MAEEKLPPPPGPPPGYGRAREEFQAPQGPPPSHRQGQRVAFAPVTSQSGHSSEYLPPPGPPPGYKQKTAEADLYSQGHSQSNPAPQMSSSDEPLPYHDWTIVQDTAMLPPPPSIYYGNSPTANASESEYDRAQAWCQVNPLWPPRELTNLEQRGLKIGFATLIKPQSFSGSVTPDRAKPGCFEVQSSSRCGDSCLLSNLPLYSLQHLSPLQTEIPRTIYFELLVRKMAPDAGIAIGYIAPPYPTWRLPGWERASLGVHGDDGRKYVNNAFGGADFTSSFKNGDVLGMGMTFKLQGENLAGGARRAVPLDVDVFFTRNGGMEAGWDLHEEVDSNMVQPGGVRGLEGDRDLYAAIGVFGVADFRIVFGRKNWLHKPPEV